MLDAILRKNIEGTDLVGSIFVRWTIEHPFFEGNDSESPLPKNILQPWSNVELCL